MLRLTGEKHTNRDAVSIAHSTADGIPQSGKQLFHS